MPDAVREEAVRIQEALRPAVAGARWVPAENLHVTIAFLGESDRAADVADALTQIAAGLPAPDVTLGGAGAFPSQRRARVLWLGLADDGTLGRAAALVADALRPLGFRPEDRAFTAHLTIARLKTPAPVELGEPSVAPIGFRPPGISLMRSHLGRPAPRYERVAMAPFRPSA